MTIIAQGTSLFAEDADERVRYRVGAAGFSHHFAEHGAQRDDDGDMPERSANAHFEGVDNGG